MKYTVSVSVYFKPTPPEGEGYNLSFTKVFRISGDHFSDIAPKMDAIQNAIEMIRDDDSPA